ncbi:MAG: LptF/LptG family permease [Candidatus Saganbacteria bacterium]|nr:LptF/LptG family permease [Candidatus Saganbacteria bacterium]
MKIVDRYLISELGIPFLIGIIGFVLIMTTDLLFTFVDMIINKGVPAWAIIRLILYKLPSIMVLTFPVSFLFAAAIVLGRMARESELAAMRTSGVSFFRIAAPILAVSLAVSAAAFVTNEAVVPVANRISDRIIREIVYKQPPADVKEQVFFRDNFNRFIYVRRFYPRTSTMDDVMIYDMSGGKFPKVITAKTGSITPDRWFLKDGAIHSYDDTGKINYAAGFSDMDITVKDDFMNFSDQKTSDEMSSGELFGTIKTLKQAGVNTTMLATDFQMKFSIPMTTLVFAMLSIPLSIPAQRAGKSWGFALSIIVIFTFYVFASVFRSMGRGGMVSPMIAAWLPPVLVSLIGGSLILREGSK